MTASAQNIGFIGAGEMGAALARQFAEAGARTFTVAHGRSQETLARIAEAGMRGVGDLENAGGHL